MALLPGRPVHHTATVLSPALTSDQRGFPIIGLSDIQRRHRHGLVSSLQATQPKPRHRRHFPRRAFP